jgi:hypothetical protein
MDNEIIKLRNMAGSITAIDGDPCTEDNLAIILASYFESSQDCPEDDIDHEIGWSKWAVEKTHCVIDRVVKTIRAEAEAEALREAADRLRTTFFRDTGPYGYDGAKSNVDALNECETLCAAITQEPKQ